MKCIREILSGEQKMWKKKEKNFILEHDLNLSIVMFKNLQERKTQSRQSASLIIFTYKFSRNTAHKLPEDNVHML
jgi:hypothetical protein